MSGIAAAISFDGDGSSLRNLEILIAAASHRGPDGAVSWHDHHAALGLLRHDLFDGSPSAPLASGPHALVFAGRLDNRDDLVRRPRISHGARLDDGAVALAAWLQSGDEAVSELEGDFALVAWNSATRRVVAARDRLGVRPLHWTYAGSRLLIASDIAQLTAVCGTPQPDTSAVADLLAGEPPADERTLFNGIKRVPPGHMLVADEHGCRLRRYWTPDPSPVIDTRSDDDWASECRALIERAVAARMRARGRVAVFFSGGVDSSVVLTIANDIAAAQGTDPPVPVSLSFDDPESDESEYRGAVASHIGIEPLIVRPPAIDGQLLRRQAERRLTLPDLPADTSAPALRRTAKAAGASVGLTGVGPDLLFSGSTSRYADLLARGHMLAAVSRFAQDYFTEFSGWTPHGLVSSGVWPLLPSRVRSVLRAPARRIVGLRGERQWLRLQPTERPPVPDPPHDVPHATWEIFWSFSDGWTTYFAETAERGASEARFEERQPLMDAALVRFALSLPEDQRRRGRITKFVLRRAVPELAPLVAARTSKATFGHLMRDALAAAGGRQLFRTLAIAEAGWVDAAALARRYDRLCRSNDERAQRDMPILWMVAATELWYRAAYVGTRTIEGAMAV